MILGNPARLNTLAKLGTSEYESIKSCILFELGFLFLLTTALLDFTAISGTENGAVGVGNGTEKTGQPKTLTTLEEVLICRIPRVVQRSIN